MPPKKNRKNDAHPLPIGITQEQMKPYMLYCYEFCDAERTKPREYFKIDRHPKLDKNYSSSKSNKVSIQQKYEQVITVINILNAKIEANPDADKFALNDILAELPANPNALPPNVSLNMLGGHPYLIYKRKVSENDVKTFKMKLPIGGYQMEEQLQRLDGNIIKKYGEEYKIM
jgi:hypothetical protein